MKFQNYDVDNIALVRRAFECIPFIQEVLSVCNPCIMDAEKRINADVQIKNLPIEPIRKIYTHSYNDVAIMAHLLPIYLRAGKPESKDDTLGTYVYSVKGKSPYINLYIEAIAEATGAKKENGKIKETMNDDHFKWLLTFTLLHEVMHAIMDVKNQSGFKRVPKMKRSDQSRSQSPYDYYLWREESYANGGALWIIRNYAESLNNVDAAQQFVKYIEMFMIIHQPNEYSLGIQVADFPECYMPYWIKEKMSGTCVEAELQAWSDELCPDTRQQIIGNNALPEPQKSILTTKK